jgi:integration host factor subunit beta
MRDDPESLRVDGERSMTKSELIELIAAKQSHLPAKDVELAVKQILEIMSDALAQGQRIEIRGFGSFSLHFRPPRQGRNPKTGETVALAGKYVPHFKPGKDLRERVNDPLEDNDAGGSDVTPQRFSASSPSTVD